MKKAARNKQLEKVIEKVEEEMKEVKEIEEQVIQKPARKFFRKRYLQIGGFVLGVLVLVGAGYYQVGRLKNAPENASKLNDAQVQDLVSEVGDKMVLPNETPTVATVSDVSKLQDQSFFKNAENGDKVLIFNTAKEAILYRTNIHKIIAVSPVNLPAANPTPSTVLGAATQATPSATSPTLSPTPTKVQQKLKVVVLNSTKTAGLAKKAADMLDKNVVSVISTSNAQGEYDKTTVSNVSGNKISDSEMKTITGVYSKVSVSVSQLPSGEAAPAGADVVILLGKDFAGQY